jgi:hypothetical protein
MGVDPRHDVRRIGAFQSPGRRLQMRKVKAEARLGCHADFAAQNAAQQDGAGRLAGGDDALWLPAGQC